MHLGWLMATLASMVVSFLVSQPAFAGAIDPYVVRYLRVTEPVSMPVNAQGETRLFSPAELSLGKRLFEENCKTCHVGGTTLPNPPISLSLSALKAAKPPRDTIASLVAYSRHPVASDGSEEEVLCRAVSESWLNDTQLAQIAAFILKAAEKAPGWGSDMF
jgi:photosystem II cytochrome c550